MQCQRSEGDDRELHERAPPIRRNYIEYSERHEHPHRHMPYFPSETRWGQHSSFPPMNDYEADLWKYKMQMSSGYHNSEQDWHDKDNFGPVRDGYSARSHHPYNNSSGGYEHHHNRFDANWQGGRHLPPHPGASGSMPALHAPQHARDVRSGPGGRDIEEESTRRRRSEGDPRQRQRHHPRNANGGPVSDGGNRHQPKKPHPLVVELRDLAKVCVVFVCFSESQIV